MVVVREWLEEWIAHCTGCRVRYHIGWTLGGEWEERLEWREAPSFEKGKPN